MNQYLDLLSKVLTEGIDTEDRTGVGTRSIFGTQLRFDLRDNFPLLTTKKIHWKSVVGELLWILKGYTNTNYLHRTGITIWDEWADKEGNLGPVYGHQWRNWGGSWEDDDFMDWKVKGIDQISQVLDTLKTNPTSRRMVVSAWNVADLPDMALAPCHCLFQFHTSLLTLKEREGIWQKIPRHLRATPPSHKFGGTEEEEHEDYDGQGIPRRKLNCQLYQRSADIFLGLPFNIASYSLLTLMVAQCVNMVPGEFIWVGGDTHLYSTHTTQALQQLSRSPQPLPMVTLNPEIKDLFAFTFGDITLNDYHPLPTIKAPVAV